MSLSPKSKNDLPSHSCPSRQLDLEDREMATVFRLSYGIALSRVRNHHDAEEIASQVILKSLALQRDGKEAPDILRQIPRITRHLVIDSVRSRNRAGEVPLDALGNVGHIVGQHAHPERRLDLALALERLPDMERHVLSLLYVECNGPHFLDTKTGVA